MGYINVKGLLIDAAKFPAAVEAKLPEGAPVISTMLIDTAGRIPVVPDFPIEIPELPAPPELPAAPATAGLRRYVSGVEVTPVPVGASARVPVNARITREVIPSPAVGVIPEVISRRGM